MEILNGALLELAFPNGIQKDFDFRMGLFYYYYYVIFHCTLIVKIR